MREKGTEWLTSSLMVLSERTSNMRSFQFNFVETFAREGQRVGECFDDASSHCTSKGTSRNIELDVLEVV